MALILTVEDAIVTRRVICKNLQAAGHVTIEATNGKEGLQIALAQNPDCILLDLLIPELSGFQVLKALKEQGSRIPVIVLTADIQETSRQRCLDLGAMTVIYKPPQKGELLDAINKALAFNEETTL